MPEEKTPAYFLVLDDKKSLQYIRYDDNLTFEAKERKKSAIMAQLSRETDFYYSPKVVAYGGFDLFLSNPPTLP